MDEWLRNFASGAPIMVAFLLAGIGLVAVMRWLGNAQPGAGHLRRFLTAKRIVSEGLCRYCQERPRLEGEAYCSEECARHDADAQAHGL